MPKLTPQAGAMIHYPQNLPIAAKKEEIIRTIDQNQVTIVIGEAGSGKTTQLPKMCLEWLKDAPGLIGCTQPRRMAAVMAARRIAGELGEELGQQVGYKIRFEEKTGRRQRIKIMTDGIMLMEAQNDPLLRRYDVIIIDEAHERSLNIDFLLGILKRIAPIRPRLKIIITSATIDAQKFSQYFFAAPIIEVSGRLYPVDIIYRPFTSEEAEEAGYPEKAVQIAEEITSCYPPGDILIFMPTEADIRETCTLLKGRYPADTLVLPFFARLSRAEQERVFQPGRARRIIVATNIAETSLTIPGIRYVVDSGLARVSEYNPRAKTMSLPIRAISACSADQRRGRCGRLANGVCFRLYAEEDYQQMPLFTPPELVRSNLAEVILRMLYLNLGDPADFPFLDPPPLKYIQDGLDTLLELGAIVYSSTPDRGGEAPEQKRRRVELTAQGKMMARLPLDPRIAKMIISAEKEKCLGEILIIAAALTIPDPRETPLEEPAKAREAHRRFHEPDSDFLGLLKLYGEFALFWEKAAPKAAAKKFAREHYLSYRRLREWRDIVEQLTEILAEHGIKITAAPTADDRRYERIHKSLISGYLSQIAHRKEKNVYLGARGRQLHIFPGSALFNKGSRWIVAAEILETSRLYARRLARIEPEWIEELASHLCRYTFQNPRWSSRRKEVVADEQISLYGLIIVPKRQVSYGPVNPREATEIFIREFLMSPEEEPDLPFVKHNRALIAEIRSWEDRLRRRDILVGEEAIFNFYRQRLPEIYNLKSLQKLIRDPQQDRLLRMQPADLLLKDPTAEISRYPDQVSIASTPVAVSYTFAYGNEADGVTLKLPLAIQARLPDCLPETIIPGLWEEKIWQLLKGLPKEWRKALHPLKETQRLILERFQPSGGPLVSELSRFIKEERRVDIPATAWPLERIDEYLKLRFSLIDENGVEQFASRDLKTIRALTANYNQHPAFVEAREQWEREGLSTWDFPDLPEEISLEHQGRRCGTAFPGLMVTQKGVALKLFLNPQEAQACHVAGLIALCREHLAVHFRRIKKHLILTEQTRACLESWQNTNTFLAELQKQLIRENFPLDIREGQRFFRHAEELKSLILPKAQEIFNRSVPLLLAFQEAAERLEKLAGQNRGNQSALQWVEKLKEELRELLPADFLCRYEQERYKCLMRFFRGLTIRAERGLLHLEKAWEKTRQVEKYAQILAEARSGLTMDKSPNQAQAVEELFWMIEEYKISLFAQELKTRFPISPKRLDEQIGKLS